MTWNIVAAGRREDVKAHIRTLPRVPECIRGVLFAAMDKVPGAEVCLIVESAGHLDDSGGNVKFSVRVKQVFAGVRAGEVVG